jgi:hypothetical protein
MRAKTKATTTVSATCDHHRLLSSGVLNKDNLGESVLFIASQPLPVIIRSRGLFGAAGVQQVAVVQPADQPTSELSIAIRRVTELSFINQATGSRNSLQGQLMRVRVPSPVGLHGETVNDRNAEEIYPCLILACMHTPCGP